MLNYYYTPSLLNSWDYAMRNELDFEIGKVEVTQAMQDGLDFENRVQSLLDGNFTSVNADYDDCVSRVAKKVKGCIPQMCVRKDIVVNDCNHLVFGFADYVGSNVIYDVKFSKSYDMGKYMHSIQHVMYMYCLGIENFAYIISDGRDVYMEHYHCPFKDHVELEAKIRNKITSFMDWLTLHEGVLNDFENKHLRSNKEGK